MIIIQATCHACRSTFDLTSPEVLLSLPQSQDETGAPEVLHGCRACGFATAVQVDWRLAALLLQDGVIAMQTSGVVGGVPGEVHDPARGEQRPLTLDDLLDLHELLALSGWRDQLSGPEA